MGNQGDKGNKGDQGKKKEKVALSSVVASFFLTVIKLTVGVLTGSISILSEAAHSALDFGAALLTYFSVRIGDTPADKEHPFGHAKVESVSSLIETGLLFLTSAWIIYEAVHRLIQGKTHIEVAWYSYAVIVLAIIVDFSRSRVLNKIAKETKSQALEADALHFSSDILSSGVVLLGLAFVSFGVNKADAIAAIGVSFFVLHAGYSLGKRTIDVLVDAAPAGVTERIRSSVLKSAGVLGVGKIRVRPVGAVAFVDMVINVSRKMPLEKSNLVYAEVEKCVRSIIPEADVTIQIKPIVLNDETIMERVALEALNLGLSVHDIIIHSLEGNQYLSFDLEVSETLTLAQAHYKATKLEEKIKSDVDNDLIVSTHIEPLRLNIVQGKKVAPEQEAKLKAVITEITGKFAQVDSAHEIDIRKIQNKYFISLHVLLSGNVQLERAHNICAHLEYLIREKIPNISRVVVHAEPEGERHRV